MHLKEKRKEGAGDLLCAGQGASVSLAGNTGAGTSFRAILSWDNTAEPLHPDTTQAPLGAGETW